MKKGLFILLIAATLGVGAFLGIRLYCNHALATENVDVPLEDASRLPELEWMHRELKLNNEQFEKVKKLHLAYRPTCQEFCDRIKVAHQKLNKISHENREITPTFEAALLEHNSLHQEAQHAMLQHLYATAACLDETQSKQYLRIMLPHALIHDEGDASPSGHHH